MTSRSRSTADAPIAAEVSSRLAVSQAAVFAMAMLAVAGVLTLDMYTPRGLAEWQLYVLIILMSLTVPGHWHVLATTCLSSAAVIAGFYLTAEWIEFPLWMSQLNRGLAVTVFWIVALGGLRIRRLAALRGINERLCREITEREAAERQVREQASLLDVTQDAITVRDRTDRITFWNRGAERLYGWSAAEAVGKTPAELMERIGATRDAAYGGEHFLARHVTRGGRDLLMDVRMSCVRDSRGEVLSELVVATDVTERRRVEAQLRQTQRLDSIGRLASGIAHDFNNMLTPVLMASKLLREDRPPDERTELISIIQSGAERGAELVRKLLHLAGAGEGPREVVCLEPLIDEVKGIIAITFPKSVRMSVRTAPGLSPVLADGTEFIQVLMNLCLNARDAMPQGGDLVIASENVTLGEPDTKGHPGAVTGSYVRVVVEDNGIGIEPDKLEAIFDPFFTDKPHGKGTGLGLSSVLGIMRGHRGIVRVDSKPGAGTRFILDWPAAAERAVIATAPPRVPLRGDGSLVLLVDDEAPILHTARASLEAGGYRVATAASGREAIHFYQRNSSDVRIVVLDVMMPDLDGAVTLAELRAHNPDCRVLLTSGLRLNGSLADAVQDGEVQFLAKPYTAVQIVDAIHRTAAT